jgi:2-polyprenyl-3-methyl-5-hydroxy-6-metoxy-1,4-benzoquinol methylase
MTKQRALLKMISDGRRRKSARLLDIGCDTGSLLRVARDDFGMNVLGVEVSHLAARVAQDEHGLDVLVGDVTELNLPSESFDIITLADVVEHVANPSALLREVSRLLIDEGRVYIYTSDHDALINSMGLTLYRLFGRWSSVLLEKLYIPYHEFYFTKSTLARLVTSVGFQIEYHANKEFPLREFGHGLPLKLGLVPVFALQKITKRQTSQELIAVKC